MPQKQNRRAGDAAALVKCNPDKIGIPRDNTADSKVKRADAHVESVS